MPLHEDRRLFEFLILEGAQAGLSWITILKKRENYRRAFDGFDAKRIASYDARKIRKLLSDPGIVRNRLKIHPPSKTPGRSSRCKRNSARLIVTSGNSWAADRWQIAGARCARSRRARLNQMP